MSAPEPTAVERTIAEVDEAHGFYRPIGDPRKPTGWRCRCGVETASLAERKTHRAQAVVAAIRAMSPTEQAELIGGTVEKMMKPEWYDSGEPAPADWLPGLAGRRRPNGNRSDLRFVPSERVVGSWIEVQP